MFEKIKLATLLFLSLLSNILYGQEIPNQLLKGRILDKTLQTPLTGATIEMMGDTKKLTVADALGYFKFDKVPVGRHSLRISFIGYRNITLSNLLVESGKEFFVSVEMEEEIVNGKEVIVIGKPNKSRPLNDMALVSARMFSVEETRRYAAGLNDPARIATAFAGVSSNGDKNSLIIRGNAPNGLLWRMEGVDIPNPNHFARVWNFWWWYLYPECTVIIQFRFHHKCIPCRIWQCLIGRI